jgi:hypothetical protein
MSVFAGAVVAVTPVVCHIVEVNPTMWQRKLDKRLKLAYGTSILQ